jgi:hypothetical protein
MIIEQNVKIPESSGKGNARGSSKYPWPDMNVGDSIFVNHTTMGSKEITYAYRWMRRNGRKLHAQTQDGGVRVWRVL